MTEYFKTSDGEFYFPDHLFPDVDRTAQQTPVPASPAEAIRTLCSDVPSEMPLNSFPWAVRVVRLAETYGSVSRDLIAAARQVIERAEHENNQYCGQSAYIQANWYYNGRMGVAENRERSRYFFRKALKSGYVRAWYHVGANAEQRGDLSKAYSRYNRGAELGDSACIYRLAMAHIMCHFGLPKSPARGTQMLEQSASSCDEDFPQPAYLLAKLCLNEMDPGFVESLGGHAANLINDKVRGLELMQRAADYGYGPALLRISAAYQGGEYGFNCAVALRYLHIVARQERFLAHRKLPVVLNGDPESQIVKWLLCGYEDTLEPNEVWAFRFAKAGAELGHPTALFGMGYFYEVGINCESDLAIANEYYRQSAELGCAAAKARIDISQDVTRKPSLRRQLTREDHDSSLRRHRSQLEYSLNTDDDPGMLAISALEENAEQPVTPERKASSSTSRAFKPERESAATVVARESLISDNPPQLPYPVSPERGELFALSKRFSSSAGPSVNSSPQGLSGNAGDGALSEQPLPPYPLIEATSKQNSDDAEAAPSTNAPPYPSETEDSATASMEPFLYDSSLESMLRHSYVSNEHKASMLDAYTSGMASQSTGNLERCFSSDPRRTFADSAKAGMLPYPDENAAVKDSISENVSSWETSRQQVRGPSALPYPDLAPTGPLATQAESPVSFKSMESSPHFGSESDGGENTNGASTTQSRQPSQSPVRRQLASTQVPNFGPRTEGQALEYSAWPRSVTPSRLTPDLDRRLSPTREEHLQKIRSNVTSMYVGGTVSLGSQLSTTSLPLQRQSDLSGSSSPRHSMHRRINSANSAVLRLLEDTPVSERRRHQDPNAIARGARAGAEPSSFAPVSAQRNGALRRPSPATGDRVSSFNRRDSEPLAARSSQQGVSPPQRRVESARYTMDFSEPSYERAPSRQSAMIHNFRKSHLSDDRRCAQARSSSASVASRPQSAAINLRGSQMSSRVSVAPSVRKPDVAYTFEEMGIKTVTENQSGKCTIM